MSDYARFFDNSLDLNGIATAEGYFRRVNIAWERTLGWTPGEILASPWLDFVHPADHQSTVDAGQRLFAGASIISFENRHRCKDGSYRLIQWHAEVVSGEAYCSGRDVTEERARFEFRVLVDNLPELAWTARPDGFIDFYNRRWYEYTGTTYKDMEGWGWQSVHDPAELPRVMASWTQCIATAQPFDQTFPLRRKDGVFRWFLTRVAPIFDNSGALIRWVGLNVDVDDQRRDQRALLEAEERFRRVFEGASVGMLMMNAAGRIALVNARIETLFGYSREELVGEPVDMLIPERFREHHPDYREGFLADPRSRPMGEGRELFGLRKDGSEVAVEIGLSPISTDEGAFVLGSVVDISERNQAERERVQLVQQLQDLNVDLEDRVRARTTELSQTLQERESLLREKTSLLQEVHHRVKNNLQMISSLLNLQAKSIKDVEVREFFRESQGRVRSIALLHESLYQSADLGRVDMQEYVDKLVATLTRTYRQSARIVTAIDQVHLTADLAVPCGLIVNELITNALKHAFPDARDAGDNAIRIEMCCEDDEVRLVVADNGVGFAGAVDPTGAETIGMTLVRDLSRQLRGLAKFETANGARCTVRFPAPQEGEGS